MSKWARTRDQASGSSNIPSLKEPDGELAETDLEKAELLRQVFFPLPLKANLSDIKRPASSPPNQIEFPPITRQEVLDAIKRAPTDKAPGVDSIPNRVWKILVANDDFVDIVTSIFHACMRTGYNPRHFQTSITVTICKGSPRDFRMPKSYRPVALLYTLGKILESIVAARIAWAVEEYGILLKTHLGGREGISVDHVMQLILDRVHRAWGSNQKVTMILLDQAGAYDNVSHQRLLFNIKRLRLGWFVSWIQSFLTGRTTRIKLHGFLSDIFPTPTGIPQGSPLIPIIFLLFNASLIAACRSRGGDGAETHGYGWVDDAAIVVVSESYHRNVQLLERVLSRADLWAKRHAARFAPDKFELIHFANPIDTQTTQTDPSRTQEEPTIDSVTTHSDTEPDIFDYAAEHPEGNDLMPVQYYDQPIQPAETAKYLGVWLDKRLRFDIHRKKLLAKANSSLEALRAMTGSVWGASLMGHVEGLPSGSGTLDALRHFHMVLPCSQNYPRVGDETHRQRIHQDSMTGGDSDRWSIQVYQCSSTQTLNCSCYPLAC